MAKASIDNLTVWLKVPNGAGFDWEVSFVAITSKGTRFEERKKYVAMTRNQMWSAIRQVALDYDAAESAPPAEPVKEFEGRYDATKATLQLLAESDYPV